MKFGALRICCPELALTDFGRDPRRSESRRASRFFCHVNNEICTQDVDLRGGESFRKTILKICRKGSFFQKGQLLREHHQRLPTSGRYLRNDYKSWKVTTGWRACLFSTCTVGMNSKSFPWPTGCAQGTTFLDIACSSV